MAEKWLRYDSMRVLTQKFNSAMDELNGLAKSHTTLEDTTLNIDDGLTNEDLDAILNTSEVNADD